VSPYRQSLWTLTTCTARGFLGRTKTDPGLSIISRNFDGVRSESRTRTPVRAAVLLIICGPAYLWSGLWSNESESLLDWRNWGGAASYSCQTMTLLKPADLVAVGSLSKWMHALESLMGPVLRGLFALALRQQLKR
jgi:hypothetical protein